MQPEARAVSDTKHDRHVDILESVVTAGGTKNIEVPGYRVGRKTGTAKAVADDGIVLDGYTASLVGIAPVDDPQYVVVVNVRRSPLPRSRCPKSTESRARLVGRNHWGTLELPSAIRLHGGLYFVFMAVLTGLAIYVLIWSSRSCGCASPKCAVPPLLQETPGARETRTAASTAG